MPDLTAKQLADLLRAGRRHAGDGDRQLGVTLEQLAHHRGCGNALAYRHRVHPNATCAYITAQREALGPTAGVGRRLDGAVQQAQQHQWHAQAEQQGIKAARHVIS